MQFGIPSEWTETVCEEDSLSSLLLITLLDWIGKSKVFLACNQGSLLFNYLGMPIFFFILKGRDIFSHWLIKLS